MQSVWRGLALRAGLQLLQNQLPALASNALNRGAARQRRPNPAKDGAGAFIHIRSKWAVGDRNGVWRSGEEEHTIEVDDG